MNNGTLIKNFDELLSHAATLPPKRVVVVFPNNRETFEAIAQACELLPVAFDLVGEPEIMREYLPILPSDGNRIVLHEALGAHEALGFALRLVREGQGDILMKGGIDTSMMMRMVLQESSGIRRDRLLSDIFLMEYPQRIENRFIMITDGGMTLAPDLQNKIELIRNAVDVAHALGNEMPKVAILSATEFVVPKLPSTLDAAALSKMNQRGQIKGCVVDGPLALDNAISEEAAAEKGIESPVAGHAEILVAANIESANSLAKSTTYFANLRLAHVIVGGSVPILIPSRVDRKDAKLLSIALGMIMSEFERTSTH